MTLHEAIKKHLSSKTFTIRIEVLDGEHSIGTQVLRVTGLDNMQTLIFDIVNAIRDWSKAHESE